MKITVATQIVDIPEDIDDAEALRTWAILRGPLSVNPEALVAAWLAERTPATTTAPGASPSVPKQVASRPYLHHRHDELFAAGGLQEVLSKPLERLVLARRAHPDAETARDPFFHVTAWLAARPKEDGKMLFPSKDAEQLFGLVQSVGTLEPSIRHVPDDFDWTFAALAAVDGVDWLTRSWVGYESTEPGYMLGMLSAQVHLSQKPGATINFCLLREIHDQASWNTRTNPSGPRTLGERLAPLLSEHDLDMKQKVPIRKALKAEGLLDEFYRVRPGAVPSPCSVIAPRRPRPLQEVLAGVLPQTVDADAFTERLCRILREADGSRVPLAPSLAPRAFGLVSLGSQRLDADPNAEPQGIDELLEDEALAPWIALTYDAESGEGELHARGREAWAIHMGRDLDAYPEAQRQAVDAILDALEELAGHEDCQSDAVLAEACRLFRRLEVMHVFQDGNARTLRLLLNHWLKRTGQAPALLANPNQFDAFSVASLVREVRQGQARTLARVEGASVSAIAPGATGLSTR